MADVNLQQIVMCQSVRSIWKPTVLLFDALQLNNLLFQLFKLFFIINGAFITFSTYQSFSLGIKIYLIFL